jgi:hypothetical protein
MKMTFDRLLRKLLAHSTVFIVFAADHNGQSNAISAVSGIFRFDDIVKAEKIDRQKVIQLLSKDVPVFTAGRDALNNWYSAPVETCMSDTFEYFIRTEGNTDYEDNLGTLPTTDEALLGLWQQLAQNILTEHPSH